MKTLVSVLYGWVGVVVVMLLASVVLTLLLRFTSLGESTLKMATLFISFIALFTGGLIAGLKAKHKGILVGSITSLLFTFIVFCYRFLGLHLGFSVVELVNHIAYLLLAIIGAIIGVNLSSGEESVD
ncbi:TIGR04086 family membrane protein [Gracilibacillus kekensis]|uniref:Putative membrane protein, TIGR04086 family n=1 Tax=Gracilibacillus kekensis TaxID=1027249 RepID=A0A1M7NYY6_9BACI|nr:TIGR04086 family membrane protein [Gracilibacillus kekensis]SHN09365.1 putative membrane protein, TIGR04086 family [Gracilibacillus kekensis]